jgi:Rad3-related DNA helicase
MARCLSIRYIPGMRILIEDLPVCFPYSLVYNEQVEYMTWLKRTLDSQGHALIEMPTGTGKTICLLALLTSYLSNRTKYKKVRSRLLSSFTALEQSWKWRRLSMKSRICFISGNKMIRQQRDF